VAIYRCELKVYGRSKAHSAVAASAYVTGTKQTDVTSEKRIGRGSNNGKATRVSAVAAAAYRAGGTLNDIGVGETHDYTAKRGVAWSGILAPDNAPQWVYDRGRLWNAVEQAEKRKDSQLFRECLLTIPRELNPTQRIALVKVFVQDQFVKRGMIADIGLHNPDASDGKDQPHAHVMLTMRDIGPDGFGKKRTDWNEVQWARAGGGNTARKGGLLEQLRQSWQDYCNAALEDAGSQARVDHRSLEARGIDRRPQPKLGKAHHAQPAGWVEKMKDNALDIWLLNRAAERGRAMTAAFRRINPMPAVHAAIAALEEQREADGPLPGQPPPHPAPAAPHPGGRGV
jgi:hypothetical protein